MIINAHPDYIPNCRGLDALKWAIYEDEPISMLVEAIQKYKKGTTLISHGKSILHKRMPNELEEELFEKFEKYKVRHVIKK